MIARIKSILRRWVLTTDEQQMLADAPRGIWRRRVLRKLLQPDVLAMVDVLEAPDRWQPDVQINETDGNAWAGALKTEVGVKIDTAMINMAQQEAQRAVHVPAELSVRQAGFAAGFRASWTMAKSLSTIAGTDAGKPEETADTGAANLAHLNP